MSLGSVVGSVKWEDLKAFLNFWQMIYTFFFFLHEPSLDSGEENCCLLSIPSLGVFHLSIISKFLPLVFNAVYSSFHSRGGNKCA